MDDKDLKNFRMQFKIVCRKCSSEDVVIDVQEAIDYGGETGVQPGSFSAGCNACKQNDFYA